MRSQACSDLFYEAPSLTIKSRNFQTMKTQYYTAASLDGFIATADDSLA
jgi:hypothetical protein